MKPLSLNRSAWRWKISPRRCSFIDPLPDNGTAVSPESIRGGYNLSLRRKDFCNESLKARVAAQGIEKRINFDEGEIVSVAIVVSLFEKIYGLILLTEAEMDHRENVWRNVALLRHFAQSFLNL